MKCNNCNKNEATVFFKAVLFSHNISDIVVLKQGENKDKIYEKVLCQGCYEVIKLLISAFFDTLKNPIVITKEGGK